MRDEALEGVFREWIVSFIVGTLDILSSLQDHGFRTRRYIIFTPTNQLSQSSVRQSSQKVEIFIFSLSDFDRCCTLILSYLQGLSGALTSQHLGVNFHTFPENKYKTFLKRFLRSYKHKFQDIRFTAPCLVLHKIS